MRSNLFRVFAIASLTVALASGCKSVKKTESDNGATAEGTAAGQQAPAITDKAIGTDPQGSDSGRIDGLVTVHFDYDKASLTSEARTQLKQNADWIKKNSQYTIQIEGHTDSRGSVEYNLALGERRAKSVKSYLESLGVESKRMTIISYGEEKPIDPAENEAAWAKNRRANFVPLQ